MTYTCSICEEQIRDKDVKMLDGEAVCPTCYVVETECKEMEK